MTETASQLAEVLDRLVHEHVSRVVAEHPTAPSGAGLGEGLLSIVAAAQWLGIGRSTVYELMQSRELPYVRIGARRLIYVDDLRHYVRQLRALDGFALPKARNGRPFVGSNPTPAAEWITPQFCAGSMAGRTPLTRMKQPYGRDSPVVTMACALRARS